MCAWDLCLLGGFDGVVWVFGVCCVIVCLPLVFGFTVLVLCWMLVLMWVGVGFGLVTMVCLCLAGNVLLLC